jgi:hypothetical protein
LAFSSRGSGLQKSKNLQSGMESFDMLRLFLPEETVRETLKKTLKKTLPDFETHKAVLSVFR